MVEVIGLVIVGAGVYALVVGNLLALAAVVTGVALFLRPDGLAQGSLVALVQAALERGDPDDGKPAG